MEVEKILSEMVQIKSVNPPGGETAVANYLKALFAAEGITGEVIESAPGRGSFVAEVGSGQKSLIYLSHIDVVPVSDGWDFAPFSGEIKDGFVYGRGTLDCKGLAAAEAVAVLQLVKEKKLNGRLIFVASGDEEAGGGMGAGYLAEHYANRLKADFAVNEGGWESIEMGGKVCHFIQTGEKGIVWQKLQSTGRSAHGSLPWLGDNAVAKMARAVQAIAAYQPEVELIPEVKQLVGAVKELEGMGAAFGDINEANIDDFIAKMTDRYFAVTIKAITRMSVSPNMISGGSKTNIVPDKCQAELDIRVMPGQDETYVQNELKKIIGDVITETIQYHEPTFSTADSPAYRLIKETMQEQLGNDLVLPCISSGSTDSKYLRGLGVTSYGIGMMVKNLDPEMKASVHGKNEKIDIESLHLKTEFLLKLARKYLLA